MIINNNINIKNNTSFQQWTIKRKPNLEKLKRVEIPVGVSLMTTGALSVAEGLFSVHAFSAYDEDMPRDSVNQIFEAHWSFLTSGFNNAAVFKESSILPLQSIFAPLTSSAYGSQFSNMGLQAHKDKKYLVSKGNPLKDGNIDVIFKKEDSKDSDIPS